MAISTVPGGHWEVTTWTWSRTPHTPEYIITYGLKHVRQSPVVLSKVSQVCEISIHLWLVLLYHCLTFGHGLEAKVLMHEAPWRVKPVTQTEQVFES